MKKHLEFGFVFLVLSLFNGLLFYVGSQAYAKAEIEGMGFTATALLSLMLVFFAISTEGLWKYKQRLYGNKNHEEV